MEQSDHKAKQKWSILIYKIKNSLSHADEVNHVDDETSESEARISSIKITSTDTISSEFKQMDIPKPEIPSTKIIDIIKQRMENSTFHGCHELVDQNKQPILRFLWLLTIIFGYVVCTFFITMSFNTYLQFNVFTKFEIIGHQPEYLPAFTFCMARNNNYSLESILWHCSYNKLETCHISDFEKVEIRKNDNLKPKTCYKLNGPSKNSFKKFFSSRDIGYRSGIQIGFYLPATDFLNYMIADNLVQPVLGELGHVTPTGATVMNLILDRNDIKKLPVPYSFCIDRINDFEEKSKYVKDILEMNKVYNYTYRQINCIEYCKSDIISKECGCDSASNLECIVLKASQDCIQTKIKKLDEVNSKFCYEQCPLECEYVEISAAKEFIRNELSSSQKSEIKKIANISGMSNQEINERLLAVYIFYGAAKYTKIIETAVMTESDLVANLGGTLGLFLGMSLISIGEIIELFYAIIKLHLKI